MKSYLVFSDIHGDSVAKRKLKAFLSECNGAFFAGDGISQLIGFCDKEWHAVRGNCDYSGEEEKVVEIDGVKILLTHGHLYGVKSGYLNLLMRAKELNAKVVIFGHTHMAEIFEEDGILFLNPGSCSTYATKKTYALLFIQNKKPFAYINDLI